MIKDERQRKYYEENRDAILARKRSRYKVESSNRSEEERKIKVEKSRDYYERTVLERRRKSKEYKELHRDEINRKAKLYRQSEAGQRSERKYLATRLGLTLEQYDGAVSGQNGKCAICGEDPQKERPRKGKLYQKRLCVDHCHKTGLFRGMLCHYCNVALGAFQDNVEIMEKAIKYIKERNVIRDDSIYVKKQPSKRTKYFPVG